MQFENVSEQQHLEKKIWPGLLVTGVFTIALGIAAIFLPFIATLTIQALLAAILIIAAVTHIIHAFQSRQSKGLTLQLLTGLLYGFIGVLLVSFPIHGALTLTVLLAVLFIFSGVFKIILAIHLKPQPSWEWLLFNGILSAILGVIIWLGLPRTGRWVIGLLVGIELVFSGLAMVMFAISLKRSNMGDNQYLYANKWNAEQKGEL